MCVFERPCQLIRLPSVVNRRITEYGVSVGWHWQEITEPLGTETCPECHFAHHKSHPLHTLWSVTNCTCRGAVLPSSGDGIALQNDSLGLFLKFGGVGWVGGVKWNAESNEIIICHNKCTNGMEQSPIQKADSCSVEKKIFCLYGTLIIIIICLLLPFISSFSPLNAPLLSSNFVLPCFTIWGRESSVGIATRYGLDGPGIESRWGGEIFRTRPDLPWGPPSLLYNGYQVFSGGKAAGAWCWPPTPI